MGPLADTTRGGATQGSLLDRSFRTTHMHPRIPKAPPNLLPPSLRKNFINVPVHVRTVNSAWLRSQEMISGNSFNGPFNDFPEIWQTHTTLTYHSHCNIGSFNHEHLLYLKVQNWFREKITIRWMSQIRAKYRQNLGYLNIWRKIIFNYFLIRIIDEYGFNYTCFENQEDSLLYFSTAYKEHLTLRFDGHWKFPIK